jgi:hypothetical protein
LKLHRSKTRSAHHYVKASLLVYLRLNLQAKFPTLPNSILFVLPYPILLRSFFSILLILPYPTQSYSDHSFFQSCSSFPTLPNPTRPTIPNPTQIILFFNPAHPTLPYPILLRPFLFFNPTHLTLPYPILLVLLYPILLRPFFFFNPTHPTLPNPTQAILIFESYSALP